MEQGCNWRAFGALETGDKRWDRRGEKRRGEVIVVGEGQEVDGGLLLNLERLENAEVQTE